MKRSSSIAALLLLIPAGSTFTGGASQANSIGSIEIVAPYLIHGDNTTDPSQLQLLPPPTYSTVEKRKKRYKRHNERVAARIARKAEKAAKANKTAPLHLPPSVSERPDLSPQPAFAKVSGNYNGTVKHIENERRKLVREFQKAGTPSAQRAVIEKAKAFFLESIVQEILPEWYGTPWDFYGHTPTPKKGKIACGYLVSTALEHMGVNVNRYHLAQQWPINMARTFAPEHKIQRYYQKSAVEQAVRNQGYGIYLLGMDNHVGFVKYDQWGIQFIHSDYVNKRGVVAETIQHSVAMNHSRNFYIVPISNDDQMMKAWLSKRHFKVKRG